MCGAPHLAPPLAEQHDYSQVACCGREAEGAHAVFGHHVHAGPKLQQQEGNLLVPEVALDAEHRRVVQDLRAVIHVCTAEHQQTAHLIVQMKCKHRQMVLEQRHQSGNAQCACVLQ